MEYCIEQLIPEKELEERIIKLADQIMSDYKDKEIVFICVLKGSCFFATELAKRISNNVEMEFIQVSSYGAGTVSSGKITLKKDIDMSIEARDIIIVEDIIDSGNTASYLKDYFETKKPNSIKLCTMLDKKERREVAIEAEYVAFSIPNEFVVGYGLDYDEKYRNLPYVGKVIIK